MKEIMKTNKPKYTLTDGEERNAKHPDTFWIPEKSEREALKPGQSVKCIFEDGKHHAERMWVTVVSVNPDGSYVGALDNRPMCIKAKVGEPVAFSAKHVINIYQSPTP